MVWSTGHHIRPLGLIVGGNRNLWTLRAVYQGGGGHLVKWCGIKRTWRRGRSYHRVEMKSDVCYSKRWGKLLSHGLWATVRGHFARTADLRRDAMGRCDRGLLHHCPGDSITVWFNYLSPGIYDRDGYWVAAACIWNLFADATLFLLFYGKFWSLGNTKITIFFL